MEEEYHYTDINVPNLIAKFENIIVNVNLLLHDKEREEDLATKVAIMDGYARTLSGLTDEELGSLQIKRDNLISAAELSRQMFENRDSLEISDTCADVLLFDSDDSLTEGDNDDDRTALQQLWDNDDADKKGKSGKSRKSTQDREEQIDQIARDIADLKLMFAEHGIAVQQGQETLDEIHTEVGRTSKTNELVKLELKKDDGWLSTLRGNKYLIAAIGFGSTVLVVTPFLLDLVAEKGKRATNAKKAETAAEKEVL